MIRAYAADDALATLTVFTRAVREVARRDYSLEQVSAWAPDDLPVLEWNARRLAERTSVAILDDEVAGFISVADDYVDMLFVHPLFTRRGVAAELLASAGDGPLWTNASITARGFFEQQGFTVEAEQRVELRGQTLTNYRMVRGPLAG